MLKVMDLYSLSTDMQQFITEYAKQLALFYEKMEILANVDPNKVLKIYQHLKAGLHITSCLYFQLNQLKHCRLQCVLLLTGSRV